MNEFENILRTSNKDPTSAVSSVSTGDVGEKDGLPDLGKLTLEKGGPLDVEDLGGDEASWRAASNEGRIKEIGSLGEGASGAVNRCILEGGKTVFALKVWSIYPWLV